MLEKPALRRRLRHVLGHLPEATKTTASATLRDRLLAWPCFQEAPVVALFYSTVTEPDLLPLLQATDKTFLLPLCHPDRSLTWHRPLHLDRWRTACLVGHGPHQDHLGHVHRHRGTPHSETVTEANPSLVAIASWQGVVMGYHPHSCREGAMNAHFSGAIAADRKPLTQPLR